MAALIMARPLAAIGELSLGVFALEAPALCAHAIRALQSDAELDSLTGGGAPSGREGSAPALRLGEIASAPSAAAAVEAVEVLRGVLWEALLEEVGTVSEDRAALRRVADLSDRLAYVCSSLLVVAVRRADEETEARVGDVAQVSAGGPDTAPPIGGGAAPAPMGAAVIVDEHVRLSRPEPPQPPGVRLAQAPGDGSAAWEDLRDGAHVGVGPEIEIRDERSEEGPAAWIGSIGRQLARYHEDARPFAVLLVEPVSIELLRDAPEDLARVDLALRRVLLDALRASPADGSRASLTRQSPGRYWLVAPLPDRAAVGELAARLTSAAARVRSDRAGAQQIAVGAALCPDDGRDAPALAAHADVSLYAARSASGLSRRHTIIDEPA